MPVRTLFDLVKRGSVRPSARLGTARRPAASRLGVEALGDRIVPAALSVSDTVIVEGAAETTQIAVVRVTLAAPGAKTASVNYATADGTARAGSDYDAVSGTLTFAPGETSKTIIVPVHGDSLREGDETFSLNLKGAKNARIADGQGMVTIKDDRPAVRISNAEASPSATQPYPGTLTFTVSLSAAFAQTVTVNYATADVTALAGADYVAAAGTLTFAPGETEKTITVAILGDHTNDPTSKELRVDLSVNYADGLVVDTWGYGILWNNDGYGDGYGLGDAGY